jgi:hypothetical protein
MKTKNSIISTPQLFQDDKPEPDVWWGEDGIDAQLWAEGQFYYGPAERSVSHCKPPIRG